MYSCEYQMTAGDIATYCLKPRLEDIPLYPPPDDTPGSCSCNMGKLLVSLYRPPPRLTPVELMAKKLPVN